MRKFILTAVAFLSIASVTLAQSDDKGSGKRDDKKEWGKQEGMENKEAIMRRLNLTDDQKAKIMDLVKNGKERRTAINTDSKLTQQQKNQQLDALRDEGRNKVKAILTAEQQKEYVKLRKEARRRYSQDKKNGNGTPIKEPSDVILSDE